MSTADPLRKYFVLAVLAAGFGVLVWQLVTPNDATSRATVDLKVPDLSATASNGKMSDVVFV
ncbi:MAG TPA: hypothetical protein VFB31_15040 [Pseudolabrys sp.]|nr:hypothetical protein [Pseudolabrys sp.]